MPPALLSPGIVGLGTGGIDVLVDRCEIEVFSGLGGNGVQISPPAVDPLLSTDTTGGVGITSDGVGTTTEPSPLLGMFVVEIPPAPPPTSETGPPMHT